MDHLVLLLEPVDDRYRVRVARAQVGEDPGVLEPVVTGDQPAVRLAVGAEGPVVLAHRHRVDRRARRAHREVAPHHLLDDVAHLGQLGPQVVVHVLEVLRHRQLGRSVGRLLDRVGAHRVGRSTRLVPRQDAGQPGAVVGRRRDDGSARRGSDCGRGVLAQSASRRARVANQREATSRHPSRVPSPGAHARWRRGRAPSVRPPRRIGARRPRRRCQDVGGHPLLEGELRELLGPVGRPPAQEARRPTRTTPTRCRAAARPPGRARPSTAASSMRAFIAPRVSGGA